MGLPPGPAGAHCHLPVSVKVPSFHPAAWTKTLGSFRSCLALPPHCPFTSKSLSKPISSPCKLVPERGHLLPSLRPPPGTGHHRAPSWGLRSWRADPTLLPLSPCLRGDTAVPRGAQSCLILGPSQAQTPCCIHLSSQHGERICARFPRGTLGHISRDGFLPNC